jgi:hypothetical protein
VDRVTKRNGVGLGPSRIPSPTTNMHMRPITLARKGLSQHVRICGNHPRFLDPRTFRSNFRCKTVHAPMHKEVLQPDVSFNVSHTFESPIVTSLRPLDGNDPPLFMNQGYQLCRCDPQSIKEIQMSRHATSMFLRERCVDPLPGTPSRARNADPQKHVRY